MNLACTEFAREYLDARGMHRKILPMLLSEERKARGIGFVVSGGVPGQLSRADWLRGQYPAARVAA